MNSFFTQQTPTPHSTVRVSAARPELMYYRGYDCQRISDKIIFVWQTCVCSVCQEPLTTNEAYLSSQASAEILQRNGLNTWVGAIPGHAKKPHSEGPILCSAHYTEWLMGESHAKLGPVTTRKLPA
jgi:hypothetical protein